MTTIMGMKVREPYEAIILGTDLQASYNKSIPTKEGILFQPRKSIGEKLVFTPKKDLVIAMTGAYTPEYSKLVDILTDKNPNDERFDKFNLENFLKELEAGYSPLIARLNYDSITINGFEFNTDNSFSLAVASRIGGSIGMYEVFGTGKVIKRGGLAMGSGAEDALNVYNVMSQVVDLPEECKTELSKGVYIILKALEFASMNDNYSAGQHLIIVSKSGIRDCNEEMKEQTEKHWKEIKRNFLTSLNEQ